SIIKNMIPRKQVEKSIDWDPPSPSTIYIKIKNIPYETFKTRLNDSLVSKELDQIRSRLERHLYCCRTCAKGLDGRCVITSKKTEPACICKSFVPKKEFTDLDPSPDKEKFRYLSEIGFQRKCSRNDHENAKPEDNETEKLYEKGVALYRQGRLKLSLEVFDNVLSENQIHFPTIFNKGNALLKLKRYEEALETFEKAAEINPDHSGLWTNIGFALMKLENFKRAFEAFERSISLNPLQKNAWEGKDAVLIRISRCKEDIKELEKALLRNSGDAGLWFEKGKLHMKLEESEEARKAFEKALEIKPGDAASWYLRGKILFETCMETDALYAFEKAVRQRPDFPEAWYEKGRVFLRLDNPKAAENAFKIAAELWGNKGLKV
ncbi:MAG TPA: tetratricopeptide repeat protein, partial [Methanosarcina sp.]|nr:tetratricopeptide repeat protein [Methanosarcina sp.]